MNANLGFLNAPQSTLPLLCAPRVQFGYGAVTHLGSQLQALGVQRPLFVTDPGVVKHGVFGKVTATLNAGDAAQTFERTPENPTVAGVEQALAQYRAARCDGIVAVGGGSVIDTAKALAVIATHPGALTDYLGKGDRVGPSAAPLVAVPTTAGTGSESSRGCGIHRDDRTAAQGISSAHIVPKVAICDPELTLTLPPHLTAGTGMDALSHCIEGYLSPAANPLIDAVALDGVSSVFQWVERAVRDGADREARWHLMMAALEGGLAIGKGLGPAHAIANAFGDQGLHHGMMVTIALPPVLELYERHVPGILEPLACAMGVKPGETAAAVERLNDALGVPRSLAALGYKPGSAATLVEQTLNSHFNATAPYRPSQAETEHLVERMLMRD